MKVRRLGQHDGALLEAALREVFQSEEDLRGSVSRSHLDRTVADTNCYFFVCVLETIPIAFLSAYRFPDVERDGFLVYLYDIIVRVEHRRRGVAGRLVEALKEDCRADGVTRIWVGTSVANHAAVRTFQATGAQRVSETYIEYIYDLSTGDRAV